MSMGWLHGLFVDCMLVLAVLRMRTHEALLQPTLHHLVEEVCSAEEEEENGEEC